MDRAGDTLRAVWPAALCVALLCLPFDSRWIDFELARRGLLLMLGGLLMFQMARSGQWASCRPRGWLLLWAFVLLGFFGPAHLANYEAKAYDFGHWLSLICLFFWGAGQPKERLIAATLPTLLIIALYGIAQAMGLDWPAGYARPTEAVSTLGNRNVAAEVTAIGIALGALLVAKAQSLRVLLITGIGLLIPALYLGLLGSRGGWLAAICAWCFAAASVVGPRVSTRLAVLNAVLLVGLLGALLRPTEPESTPPPNAEVTVVEPSTLDVRIELWKGGLRMIESAPWFGQGAGQFRYNYPRYRSQEEIELTSFGRQFATTAHSLHQDYLQVAVERGLIGAALLAAFLLWVVIPRLRRRQDWALLAPVVAFGVLALVRAPLGNAPTAAMLFVWLGYLAGGDDPRPWPFRYSTWTRMSLLLFGAVMLVAGAGVVIAEQAAANWLRTKQPESLRLATQANLAEPRYHSLLIQTERRGLAPEAAMEACLNDLHQLGRRDPNNTHSLLLTAEMAHAAGHSDWTDRSLTRLLALDPRHPEGVLLAAVVLIERGSTAQGIATLYADPHPRLREDLAQHLDDLANAPLLADRPNDQTLLRYEARFVRALDHCLAKPGSALANEAVRLFMDQARKDDDRALALMARQLQALGEVEMADRLAPQPARFNSSARRMMAPLLDELRALPNWKQALAED